MTTLFNNTAITAAPPIGTPARRKARSWLPLLTVLFLFSYALMTLLIVEQGTTIESQRALIQELFRDSTELSLSKMKAQQQKALAEAQRAQSAAKSQAPVTQNPSSRIPSTQAPQAPSSQAVPQRGAQSQTAKQKQQFRVPTRPAADLADDRRALRKI